MAQVADMLAIPDLTEADYDVLYVELRREALRVSREIFPAALAQLVNSGALELIVTDLDITASMPDAPEFGVYRVERKRSPH